MIHNEMELSTCNIIIIWFGVVYFCGSVSFALQL